MLDKKDGKILNLYIDKKVIEQLEKYALKKGQTKTIALKRLAYNVLVFFNDFIRTL